jgi:hypothetical protein
MRIFSALLPALPILFGLALAGCKPSNPGAIALPTPASSASSAARTFPTDAWIGTWTGPEGTSLLIAGGEGQYQVTIRNLDGPRTYQASPGDGDGQEIRFERNNSKETIRASTGTQTGMKWLSEKKDCLTIRYGEGYCRD